MTRSFTYQALPMRVIAVPTTYAGSDIEARSEAQYGARLCGGALGGVEDPARELWEMAGRLGAPRSLRELGMAEHDIPRIIALAVAAPYADPRARDHRGPLLAAARGVGGGAAAGLKRARHTAT